METRAPRLRVFAGPNGSGKSTVIDFIKNYKVNNRNVDFGYYINADIISSILKRNEAYPFEQYDIDANHEEFNAIISNSGLLNKDFHLDNLIQAYRIVDNSIYCADETKIERLAQIIAEYLRKKLLLEKKRFSFETVFSHKSKIDIMRQAVTAGYKVYLYFVCTESPEINKFRVEARTKKGGHSVPLDKIETRYYRALDLLHDASQLAYQAFFFDNSEEGKDFKMFAHFKMVGGKKVWDDINESEIPNWFKIHYVEKVAKL
jgi:predicted ABC-type ATPase